MHPANLLTEWASLLLTSFADAGVRDVVVSPGSRSAPFVAGAVRERRLVCHSIIDERAASFFALGQARLTGHPSLLLCTSGTAGAHYLPAVIEAGLSFVPLLILTADRPTELQDCAAPQTIDQLKLFGGHVRQFFDLAMPDPSEGALIAIRRVAAQATFRCVHTTPGPVHLNARARKPLEPLRPDTDDDRRLAERVLRVAATPITAAAAPRTVPNDEAIRSTAALCRGARRGLIVCGPASATLAHERRATFELARVTGFPLACEATSQLRFAPSPRDVTIVGAFDVLFRSAAFCQEGPDFVLHVGAPPVSGGWERFAVSSTAQRVILADHGWPDPQSTASRIIFGEPIASVRALTSALGDVGGVQPELGSWSEFIATADAAAWQTVDTELRSSDALTEGHAVRAVVSELPRDSVFVVGNSLAVRLVDTFCRPATAVVTVVSQRGTSGIEGLIAGAAGSATKSATPVTLLLGDVSFVHDMTSLSLARRCAVPVVVIVLQNGGGRIFEQLPIAGVAGSEPELLKLTVTPHDTNVMLAAATFGVRAVRAATEQELREALRQAYLTPGCTVVEAVAPENGAAPQHRRIWASADAAVAQLRRDRHLK